MFIIKLLRKIKRKGRDATNLEKNLDLASNLRYLDLDLDLFIRFGFGFGFVVQVWIRVWIWCQRFG